MEQIDPMEAVGDDAESALKRMLLEVVGGPMMAAVKHRRQGAQPDPAAIEAVVLTASMKPTEMTPKSRPQIRATGKIIE